MRTMQANTQKNRELKLLSMKHLIAAFSNDPDIVNVAAATHTQVMQTLFVVTGCDYISFFNGIGKATFLKYFFQHSDFISGDLQYTCGSLSDTVMDSGSYKQVFFAFIRLIGTVYFKKHANAFDSNSPVAHYKKFMNPETDIETQHRKWLEDIRQNIWIESCLRQK